MCINNYFKNNWSHYNWFKNNRFKTEWFKNNWLKMIWKKRTDLKIDALNMNDFIKAYSICESTFHMSAALTDKSNQSNCKTHIISKIILILFILVTGQIYSGKEDHHLHEHNFLVWDWRRKMYYAATIKIYQHIQLLLFWQRQTNRQPLLSKEHIFTPW